MTSSPSSSDSSSSSSPPSSTKLSPSLSQYNFDPFAEHPFTNCGSSNPNPSPNASTVNYPYAYPYRQPLGNHPSPQAPVPNQQSPPKPYALAPSHHKGIFVPFRKETPPPDLSAILKPKSDSSSSTPSTTSKSRPA